MSKEKSSGDSSINIPSNSRDESSSPLHIQGRFSQLPHLKFPEQGTFAKRVSILQRSESGGTLERPAVSRPLFVNLRLSPKEIVPARSMRSEANITRKEVEKII